MGSSIPKLKLILFPVLLLSVPVILLLSLAWPSSISVEESFHRCLLNQPQDSSRPISEGIYIQNHPPFSSVLNEYVRNLRFNTSTTPKPFLIITAKHESHVKAAVVCGRKHNLQMKIRSGGHDYEGSSYVVKDPKVPFFILDMFNLRRIEIDVNNETAWVQTGATLGELYYKIANASNTLGFPAGVCPSVGVGGHIGGGGFGNLMRKYGLSADNVIDAQIIDVNGNLLDKRSMGDDLFWAIRGGGAASFGVVLSYIVKLVRVPEKVTTFKVVKTLEENATALALKWQHVAPNITEDLFVKLNLEVADAQKGKKTIKAYFVALFLGNSQSLVQIMNERFPELGLKISDCKEMSWVKSLLDNDQSIDVLLNRTFTLSYFKGKSDYVEKPISEEGLEGIWKKMLELKDVKLNFYPYGGKMSEISPSKTPFPHRAGNLWKIQYGVQWKEPGKEEDYISKSREFYGYMAPFVSENRNAFFSFKDNDLGINNNYEEASKYGVKYFGDNFVRLVDIKTEVDPGDFFKNEQSIPVHPQPKNRHGDSDKFISLVTEKKGKIGRKVII